MKKLLTLVLFALLISLAACEKTACYNCTKTTTTSIEPAVIPGYPQTSLYTEVVCDITDEGAREWERVNTTTATTNFAAYTLKVETKGSCVRQ